MGQRYSQVNPSALRKTCHSLHELLFQRGDILFTGLEMPIEPQMYFVEAGRLGYTLEVTGSEKPVNGGRMTVTAVCEATEEFLEKGAHFSEPALWVKDWLHCGTLRVLDQCRLLVLRANAFQ